MYSVSIFQMVIGYVFNFNVEVNDCYNEECNASLETLELFMVVNWL